MNEVWHQHHDSNLVNDVTDSETTITNNNDASVVTLNNRRSPFEGNWTTSETETEEEADEIEKILRLDDEAVELEEEEELYEKYFNQNSSDEEV